MSDINTNSWEPHDITSLINGDSVILYSTMEFPSDESEYYQVTWQTKNENNELASHFSFEGQYVIYNNKKLRNKRNNTLVLKTDTFANAIINTVPEYTALPDITYKTVIANAIQGFNDIQNLINQNSGQLSTATTTTPASIENIKGALKAGTITIDASLSPMGYEIKLLGQTSTDSRVIAPENYTIFTSLPTSSTTNSYFIKLAMNGTCNIQPYFRATKTAGLIKSETTYPTGTIQKFYPSGSGYVSIPEAIVSVSGGGITWNSATVSSLNATLSFSNTSGIEIIPQASVTRSAISKSITAGYITDLNSEQAVASASYSAPTTTKYLTAVTVPLSKSFSITNNGSVSMANNTTGTVTVTNNRNLITVQSAASTGMLKYVDWNIQRNTTTQSLEFQFA